MTRRLRFIFLLVCAGLALSFGQASASEPSEAEMRQAVEQYLKERNTEPEGSPRYFDATAIALFKKLSCQPPDADGISACRYRIEIGTQYRESRTTTHRFVQKDGRWVSLGPRPPQPAAVPNP